MKKIYRKFNNTSESCFNSIAKNQSPSGSCRLFSLPKIFASQNILGSPSRVVTRSWFTTLSALLLSLVVFNSVSALTYQNDTDVDFTINPTISLSISGDLIINNLTLGNSQNSNEITIAVSTNNAYGYNLSATVGNDSEYNTRDLVHNDSSLATKPTISSIDFSSDSGNYLSELTINGDNNGTWGYSIDGGDTYNGLPLYNDDSNVAVLNGSITMPENGTATTSFLIGAIASDSQAAGGYNNVINFYAVTNLAPTTFDEAFAAAGKHLYKGYYKMQDMSSSICNLVEAQGDSSIAQLIDTRDDEVYHINKLADDNCWLLDNLRLGGDNEITLTSADTNIGDDVYVLPSSGTSCFSPESCTGTNGNTGNGNTVAAINASQSSTTVTAYGSGSGRVGVYYNYCATSAGTFCTSSSIQKDIDYDICPAGWRLPTLWNGNEYNTLYLSYGSNLSSYRAALSLVLSGEYAFSAVTRQDIIGEYWTKSTIQTMTLGMYVNSSDEYSSNAWFGRHNGYSIRCLAK